MPDDDDEYFDNLMSKVKQDWQYHELCKWFPYQPNVIDEIADTMKEVGYLQDQPITIYEGAILDGRHRYEAAIKANVDPVFVEFNGSREEAINYVTALNVARKMLNGEEKQFFYIKRANALGVRKREDSLKQNTTDPTNVGTVPSAEDHADSIGVAPRTVERWEKDRKEIMQDPDLSSKIDTFDGFKEAKKEVKERRQARKLIVPDYDVATTLGALKGMAEMFSKRYEGTHEDAASILVGELIKGCEQDDIGMSIARDYVKWFLNFKEVLDMAQPSLEAFLEDKPNLKIVN